MGTLANKTVYIGGVPFKEFDLQNMPELVQFVGFDAHKVFLIVATRSFNPLMLQTILSTFKFMAEPHS